MKIAIQQVMLGSILKNEDTALSSLKKLKEAGLEYIELNEFMIHKAPFIVKILMNAYNMSVGNSDRLDWPKLLNESNLKVSALHSDLGSLLKDTDKVIEDARLLKTDTIVITAAYGKDNYSLEGLNSMLPRLNAVGQELSKKGIQLLYHNHNIEFLPNKEGIIPWYYILNRTDANALKFELDCYYAQSAGINVERLIEEHHDRIAMLHLTDLACKNPDKSFMPIVKTKETVLGWGSLPVREYIYLAMKYDLKALVLEMHNGFEKSVLESSLKGLDYINKIIEGNRK